MLEDWHGGKSRPVVLALRKQLWVEKEFRIILRNIDLKGGLGDMRSPHTKINQHRKNSRLTFRREAQITDLSPT